jgi:hypothetical protein
LVVIGGYAIKEEARASCAGDAMNAGWSSPELEIDVPATKRLSRNV